MEEEMISKMENKIPNTNTLIRLILDCMALGRSRHTHSHKHIPCVLQITTPIGNICEIFIGECS